MFNKSFSGCIERFWQRLKLGAPIYNEAGHASLNIDGATVLFSDALDGNGIELIIHLGYLSNDPMQRQQQLERVLQTNLATVSQLCVLAELQDEEPAKTRLQLRASCRGYGDQEKLVETLEDLMASVHLYQPFVGETSSFSADLSRGYSSPHTAPDLDNAVLFHL